MSEGESKIYSKRSKAEEIRNIRSKTVFNIEKSASIGADYITKILDN